MKHVGKINNTGTRVVVAFRVVPGEANQCLVIYSDSLPNMYHDNLMEVVESPEGQSEFELGNVLGRRMFANGQYMLTALHRQNFIKNIKSELVTMTPGGKAEIPLPTLNQMIADQKGVTVEDLAGVIDKTEGEIATDNFAAEYTGANIESKIPSLGLNEGTPNFEGGPSVSFGSGRALTDADLANNLIKQSEALSSQIEQLLVESKRLQEEAFNLNPDLKPTDSVKKTRKTPAKKES